MDFRILILLNSRKVLFFAFSSSFEDVTSLSTASYKEYAKASFIRCVEKRMPTECITKLAKSK